MKSNVTYSKLLPQQTTLNCNGTLLDLSEPKIMGVVNLTPDSFYEQSRAQTQADIQRKAEQMLTEGASILDLGAYSSRPNAEHITEEEEWKRFQPALATLRKDHPNALLSIDTFRATIAERAVNEYGANLINDISAGEMDANMFSTIAKLGVPYIMMHMQGTPQNMQDNPVYDDLLADIRNYFTPKLRQLKQLGVRDIIIDPGFGFGKTIDHNYELVSRLGGFSIFEQPILVGVSRKSFIYKLLNTEPADSLNGTTAINMIALQKGVKLLRVHDVKEARELVQLCEKLKEFAI